MLEHTAYKGPFVSLASIVWTEKGDWMNRQQHSARQSISVLGEGGGRGLSGRWKSREGCQDSAGWSNLKRGVPKGRRGICSPFFSLLHFYACKKGSRRLLWRHYCRSLRVCEREVGRCCRWPFSATLSSTHCTVCSTNIRNTVVAGTV